MGETIPSRRLLKYNTVLSLFTAVIVFVVFLLVTYILIFGPCCTEYHGSKMGKRRERKLLKLSRIEVNQGSGVNSSFTKSTNICEKDWTSLISSFMSLIPEFSHRQRRLSLSKQLFKKSNTTRPLVWVSHDHCKDNICSEYLSTFDDRSRFCSCLDSASRRNLIPHNSMCKFISGTNRDPVALISFPGSGNTWVRGLLESITGICTGAVYCDFSLRSQGFTGEYVRGGSVLVVKTHQNNPIWTDDNLKLESNKGKFGSAIFIVRNPLNALIAEWNRKVANNFTIATSNLNSHTEIVGKEWFGENKLWEEFLLRQANRWRAMIRNWVIKRQQHPVLVVKYESLKNEPIEQSKRMLDFLGVSYSDLQLESLLSEVKTFHRNHSHDFDHYTPSQRDYVESVVKGTISLLQTNRLSDVVNISDYLS